MFRRLANGLVDLIYPKACIVCKTTLKDKPSIDDLVCIGCWGKIKRNLPPFCYSCGRHLERASFVKGLCPHCVRRRLHFDRSFSPCVYEGTVKEIIHAFKYEGKDYLGATLSRLLNEFIREYSLPLEYIDFIVPVPLHNIRLREREFNQAQVLSRHIAREFKKNILEDNLVRLRHTKAQAELDTGQRLSNVKGSFSVKQKEAVKDKNILLVDDVLTTGSTSSEAAYALKEAGAGIVFVLTLAN